MLEQGKSMISFNQFVDNITNRMIRLTTSLIRINKPMQQLSIETGTQ